MNEMVTLEELLNFCRDMAEKFPEELVDITSEHMWVTAQWASSAYSGEGSFDMSTYSDIEMYDEHGESYIIDIPREFSAWNREAAGTCPIALEYPWESIALEIEKMIKSRDSLKDGLTDAR